MQRSHYIILIVALGVIMGSLIGREYPVAEAIVSAISLGLYVILNLKNILGSLRNFNSSDTLQKRNALIGVVMAILIIGIIFSGRVWYFPILLLLAIDLILSYK